MATSAHTSESVLPAVHGASTSGPPFPADAAELLRTLPWGVLALSVDGTIAALNPTAEGLWGVPTAAVLGHQPAQVQPAVLPPALLEALAEAAPAAGPYWLPHTQQWIMLRTAPAAEGRRWVYWDNVTASQQAILAASQQQAEQQNTRELLAAVETVGHIGSYEADLATLTLRFSDGLFRLFGEAPQSFAPSFAFIDSRSHPDDVLVGQGLLARTLESQEPYRYLHRIFQPDGQLRTLEVHASVLRDPAGTPVKLLGLVQDVTARQQAAADVLRGQQQLTQQATDQYRALIQALDQGYLLAEVEFDAQNRAVDILYLEANPAAVRLAGRDFTGRRLRDISPAYEAYWYEIFGRVALTGTSERLEQYAEPNQMWYDFYVFRPGDEASRRVAVVFQDVTARKRREAHAAFLATVQDDLSQLASPDEIMQAVGGKLGAYLNLATCSFLDVEATQEQDLVISYVWHADGAPRLQPSYHSSDYLSEEIVRASQAGQPTVIRDTQADGRVVARAYAQVNIGAFVGFPFRRHGEWKHSITVTSTAARDWQPEELELLGEVVQRVFPRLERARNEEALRQSEERQAFLLQLSDALRPLADPAAVQREASRVLRAQLGAGQVIYTEATGPDELLAAATDVAADIPNQLGFRYHKADFGPAMWAELDAGRTHWRDDVAADPHFSDEEKAVYLARHAPAWATVPLVKNGRLAGMLTAHFPTPHHWTPNELRLLEETAERTWAAVERARAEDALRHSEARFRSVFESMNQGFAVCELVRDETGRPIDYRVLDLNPAGERLTGITKAEFTGRRVLEMMPGLEEWWVETFAHVLETGETTRFEQYVKPLDRWRDFTVFAYDDDKFAFIYDDITARKQAEQAEATTKAWLEEQVELRTQALQASHARLNTIFEAVPLQLGYYEAVRDADGQLVDLRLVAVNRATSNMMARPDVTSGILMSAQLPGLQQQPVWQTMKQVIATGEPQRLEVRYEFGSGAVWFDVQYTRLEDGIISASLDITARKQVEQELRESQGMLQSVFDTSLISMSVLQAVRDEAGAIEDFRIAFANKELQRETGRADLVGKLYVQEYPGIKLVGIYDTMLRVMETGQPHGLEYHYLYEGFDKWYACQFVKADDGLVATNLDITERKLAELEQAKSYQLLRQSEEVASLGSWDYDRATGEFRWSEGMYRLFGLPQGSSIRPETYLDFVVPEDRPVAERIVQGLTTGRTGFEETLRIRVDGTVKTMRVKAAAALDAAGEPLRMLGVDLDISEVQRLEAENLRLRLTQQQALFQAVLGAQETERRRMAESLHNGLGQTLYAVKLQLNQLPATLASAALAQADRLLADAIRQTRTLSHELVPTVLSEFGLAAALRDICRSLGNATLRFACTVELDEPPPLPQPLQLALYRMAQELAQNVVKHAHATTASLELETVPGYVLLRVEDNGKGFASPPPTAASGIGLRTIRDQVALLGGTVDVGSSPTFGTYVRLRIPLPTPATPPA